MKKADGKRKEQDLPMSAAVPPTPPIPTPTPAPAAPLLIPAALDFKLDKPWRIERFESLVGEFQLQGEWEKVAREFVLFAREYARQWICVRRLYGIAPVVPPPGTDPKELQLWSREELQADGYDVQAELDGLRGLWNEHRRNEQVTAPPAPPPEKSAPKGELPLDDKILEQFQFPERLFKITVWDTEERRDVPRTDSEVRAEREWFVGRVKDWSKMLRNGVGGPIARAALMNELYLRRLESQIATASSKEVDKLYDRKRALTEEYQEQIDKLQAMFPDMAVAGQVGFRGAFSDAIAGCRDYYAYGDTRLLDKVFTALELEFATRESRQVPMRHRFSLSLAIAECMNHIYDPHFRSQLKPAVLKQIEAGYRGAVKALRETQNQPVVDLERGVEPGEGDQFEDFLDAVCPQCSERISSEVKECPHCQMKNPNDQITETYQ
jgi:hypothetical protein